MNRFEAEALVVPASVTTGTPVKVNPRSHVAFSLGGTFVATVKFQYSPYDSTDVWYDVSPAVTAAAYQFLEAGRAKRVRANTTAFTSGAPVAAVMYDPGLSVEDEEKTFQETALDIPGEVAAGDSFSLPEGEQATVAFSGSFTATIQLQVSLNGTVWHNWGTPVTAAAIRKVPKGMARYIRANVTAWTSSPAAVVLHGFANESDTIADALETREDISTGLVVSVFTRITELTIADAKAYTLAAGLFRGQRKSVRVDAVSGSPDGSVTPIVFGAGTSIDVDAVNENFELEWDGGTWQLVSLVGATLNA